MEYVESSVKLAPSKYTFRALQFAQRQEFGMETFSQFLKTGPSFKNGFGLRKGFILQKKKYFLLSLADNNNYTDRNK